MFWSGFQKASGSAFSHFVTGYPIKSTSILRFLIDENLHQNTFGLFSWGVRKLFAIKPASLIQTFAFFDFKTRSITLRKCWPQIFSPIQIKYLYVPLWIPVILQSKSNGCRKVCSIFVKAGVNVSAVR